jgi:hypothetical protein
MVNSSFLEVTRWRRNLFYLPSGKAGEEFIEELTKLYRHFNSGTAFEPIALTLATLIFPLLLQKPSPKSRSKDHVRFLEKRLVQWKLGKIKELLCEGRAIQGRLSSKKKSFAQKKEKRFIALMERGKVSLALKCIGSQDSLLEVSQDVLDDLKQKHPEGQPAEPDSLLQGPLGRKLVEEVIFENIDSDAIYKAAKNVSGAAGPSGGDADLWQRLLCSKQFKKKPADLCAELADLAKKVEHTSSSPNIPACLCSQSSCASRQKARCASNWYR